MKISATKVQIVTVAGVLLLLGGVTAAFAYTTNQVAPVAAVGGQPSATNTSGVSSSPQGTETSSNTTTSATSPPNAITTTTSITVCPLSETACHPCRPVFFNLQLNPVPLKGSPTTYRYGTGYALLSLRGDAIYLQVQLRHSDPLTQYSITLDINGTTHQLATMVTDQNGNGRIVAQTLLQNGRYAISVRVFDTTNFPSPTLVLQSASMTAMLPQGTLAAAVCILPPVSVNASVPDR